MKNTRSYPTLRTHPSRLGKVMSLTTHASEDFFDDVLAHLPLEELRLALVLNGGVSLAVWMGGVAHEINLLTRAGADSRDGYGPLVSAARASAVVDVIAGTSAGGINGAALALAQANEHADLLGLRRLWAEQGRMEELLRSPFQGEPNSLLRGDDFFLPELHRAMRMLAHPFTPRAARTPLDLTLTTTLLTGVQEVTIDDFGEKIPQRMHAAQFRFSNIARDGRDHGADPFDAASIGNTAAAMALAARSTASFPVAFEPSFVPVGEDALPPDPLRPRMDAHASWHDPDAGPQSRYAVDGGVLANTPVGPALHAIERRQAEGPVRRSMLLVFPHAPEAVDIPADDAEAPPRAAETLAGVLGALQAQGSRSFVEKIKEHNRRAGDWRGGRRQLLTAGGPAENPVPGLYAMLTHAWSQYRHVRLRLAARGLADKVAPREQWPYERIRSAAESAQQAWAGVESVQQRALPYVPTDFRPTEGDWQERYLFRQDAWSWGDTPARGVTDSVASVLRSALSVVTEEGPRALLADARVTVGSHLNRIDDLRRVHVDQIWLDNPYLRSLAPTQDYWRARVVAYELAMDREAPHAAELTDLLPLPDSRKPGWELLAAARTDALTALQERRGEVGVATREAVNDAVRRLVDLQRTLEALAVRTRGVSDLADWCRFLFAAPLAGEPDRDSDRLLLRLLALDAGTRLLAEGTTTGTNLPVRLAEMSLRLEHPWAVYSRTPDDKAAGLALGRFGGFLKRSWRMNDWTWGRLDAATMLCQTVLDPHRIRRLAAMSREVTGGPTQDVQFGLRWFAALEKRLYGGATLPDRLQHLRTDALTELGDLLDGRSPDPWHLPRLAQWAALPLQAEIILDELPVLASAIEVDVAEGAGQPTRGTRFLAEAKDGLLRQIAEATVAQPPLARQQRLDLGCRALAAFDAAGIGREPLGEETGSNSLIRTASKAVGAMATVLDSDAQKMPVVKPITSAVRGALLLPYWMINGLAGGGSIARFLATGGMVVGGLLVALSLFGVLGSAAAAAGTAGTAVLLAALAYSAMKTGSLLHAAALLAPVVPLTVYALDSSKGDGTAGSRVLVVVAAVAALYVLANIPWPLRSPFATVGRWWRMRDRWARRLRWVAIVVAVLMAAAVVAVLVTGDLDWQSWKTRVRDAASEVQDALVWFEGARWGWHFAVTAGVVLLGGFFAYRYGVLLRAWRSRRGTDGSGVRFPGNQKISGDFSCEVVTHPAGVAASWAPVYGAVYLVVAMVLFHLLPADSDQLWVRFMPWWFAALGVLLCLVAPWGVTRPARAAVNRLVGRSWAHASLPCRTATDTDDERPSTPEQSLLETLLKYDLLHRYLARPAHGGRRKTSALALTGRGRKLLASLEEQANEPAG